MKFTPLGFLFLFAFHPAIASGQVIMDSASTVGESYARGASDVIRSQGAANLDNSQAAINLTDARANQIENQTASVNAYWERKKVYQQHQAQKNYETQKRRQAYLDRHGLKSLTPDQFDRSTGAITWLGPLNAPEYKAYREEFQSLFTKRAQKGWLDADDYRQAKALSKKWRGELANEKGDYPSSLLSQMIRFILSLDRELNENV